MVSSSHSEKSAPTKPERVGNWRASLICACINAVDEYLHILLLLPAALLMIVVFIYPVGYAGWLSLHEWTFMTMRNPPFVGVENFVDVTISPGFLGALGRTILFVGAALLVQVLLGLALALAVNRLPAAQGWLTTLLVLPMMVTPVVVGLIWKFLLDYNFGLVGFLMEVLGMGKVAFLSNSAWAMAAVIFVDCWQWTPFTFVILLAGLKALPSEPYEAAHIDGANWWQILTLITLPFLRPVIIVAVVLRLAGLIKEFDKIYVLTGGGPGTATETIALLLHRGAFLDFDFGHASTIAMLLAAAMAVLCWWAVRMMHSEKGGHS